MTHVTLLGDSVLDNAAYVGGGAKIADALIRLVSAHNFGHRRTEVFV